MVAKHSSTIQASVGLRGKCKKCVPIHMSRQQATNAARRRIYDRQSKIMKRRSIWVVSIGKPKLGFRIVSVG